MKLTEQYLKNIIKEEISKTNRQRALLEELEQEMQMDEGFKNLVGKMMGKDWAKAGFDSEKDFQADKMRKQQRAQRDAEREAHFAKQEEEDEARKRRMAALDAAAERRQAEREREANLDRSPAVKLARDPTSAGEYWGGRDETGMNVFTEKKHKK